MTTTSLPTATYARSKVPSKELIEDMKRKERDAVYESAREKIIAAYKEGSTRIELDLIVPKAVRDEMVSVGWKVRYGDFVCTVNPYKMFEQKTIFYLQAE